MAGTTTPRHPVESDTGLQSIEVEELPAFIAEEGPVAPSDLPRRDIRRPSLVGSVVFLAFVGVLGLWGMFLILYLLKNYLGIDIFPGVSMSEGLGL